MRLIIEDDFGARIVVEEYIETYRFDLRDARGDLVSSIHDGIKRMSRVDIRRDDHEPVNANQVRSDELTRPRTAVCADPDCEIKMQPHSHKV